MWKENERCFSVREMWNFGWYNKRLWNSMFFIRSSDWREIRQRRAATPGGLNRKQCDRSFCVRACLLFFIFSDCNQTELYTGPWEIYTRSSLPTNRYRSNLINCKGLFVYSSHTQNGAPEFTSIWVSTRNFWSLFVWLARVGAIRRTVSHLCFVFLILWPRSNAIDPKTWVKLIF